MSTTTTTSITCTESHLVEQIEAEHSQVERHFRTGAAHAIRAGELLLEAKQLHVRRGKWEKWLADNVTFSARTARAYMQLAKLPAEKRNAVALLPVREVLSAIRAPHSPTENTSVDTRGHGACRSPRQQIYHSMKLTDALMAAIKGTSLDTPAVIDELIILNRGAPKGGLTEIVKRLVEEAASGKDVSALAESRGQSAQSARKSTSAAVKAAVPIEIAEPSLWKKHFNLPGKDKEAARQRALELFPSRHELLARKRDPGRAEAALIALFSLKKFRPMTAPPGAQISSTIINLQPEDIHE
jgi:hypothetical protein